MLCNFAQRVLFVVLYHDFDNDKMKSLQRKFAGSLLFVFRVAKQLKQLLRKNKSRFRVDNDPLKSSLVPFRFSAHSKCCIYMYS